MKPKICVPLPFEDITNTESMVRTASNNGADLIELRLDYHKGEVYSKLDDLWKAIRRYPIPFIATNRQSSQGGSFYHAEDSRVKSLIKAAEIGFQYVDLELTTKNLEKIVRKLKSHGSKVIISHHDFKDTPSLSQMVKISNLEIDVGAEICKVVTWANDMADNIKCIEFVLRMCKAKKKVVCFAMGEKGVFSRIFSPLFGADFTFASLNNKLETAPGQISIVDLKEAYGRIGVEF